MATEELKEHEFLTEKILLLVTKSMAEAVDKAWHSDRLPSRNDWIRQAIEAALTNRE